jgi:hypothetical protein
MSTQRERLRARSLPTRTVHLPRDPAAHAEAVTELQAALLASKSGATGARERVEAAAAAVDAVDVETFVLRCLPPPEWEALKALHPPNAEQQAKGLDWNAATFRPALLAACVVPPDGERAYSEAEWLEFAADGRVSVGEQDLLVGTAVILNTRAVQLAMGKGSAQTAS